jgi:ATP-binding protein involved in chromosome partitioning
VEFYFPPAHLAQGVYPVVQPLMLGQLGKHPEPDEQAESKIPPIKINDIQSMSIGYLLAQSSQPMIWRGPMVSRALQQLFFDTKWHALDFLIIDLPPGTGDIPLTLVQKIPLSGAIVVTTPQDIALLDARKAIEMFNKVTVPMLGIIENMATHLCQKCGHEETIFGSKGGESLANQYNLKLLGKLPLNINIRKHTDNGTIATLHQNFKELASQFIHIATEVASKVKKIKA